MPTTGRNILSFPNFPRLENHLDFGLKRVLRKKIFTPFEFFCIEILGSGEIHLLEDQLFTNHIGFFKDYMLGVSLFVIKNEPIPG